MSVIGGRGGRPDDWATQHARARARAAERIDGPIDEAEERWLDEHLADCSACAAAAADYASQRLELRAMRDRTPEAPRDLWARTAAAIELESRHRALQSGRRSRRSLLAPYAVLAGVVVVAIVVGNLTSSRIPADVATTTPGTALAATERPTAAPTPVDIGSREVAYLSRDGEGRYQWNNTRLHEVCPDDAETCATTEPNEKRTLGPLPSPESVFGADDGSLVVLGDDDQGSRVLVVTLPEQSPAPSESPTTSPATVTPSPTATAPPPTTSPTASPTTEPSPSADIPSIEPSPSVDPSQPPGTIEIARDVEVVDTTAAYAPDGSAFAFTARPSDGSQGPDIYVWYVGEATAKPITTDHRSVFGSWAGDAIVGSTVVTTQDGSTNTPTAFMYATDETITAVPEAGSAWRPAVDPTRGAAVYWTGTLEPAADGNGWLTVEGRLVLGRWHAEQPAVASDDPSAATEPTDPPATSDPSDDGTDSLESTIAEGPLLDWDVRWDETGTRLAVWIADATDPAVGRLSLFVVDPANGTIDHAKSPLVDEPALSGFSMASGRLAWAVPPRENETESRVSILAWNDDGFGQVETAPGEFFLVR